MEFKFKYEPQKELEADTYVGEIVSINTAISRITKRQNLVIEFAPYKKGKAYKHVSLWLDQTYHTKDDLAYKLISGLDNRKCDKDFADFVGCKLIVAVSATLKDGITYFNVTDISVNDKLLKENEDIHWNNKNQRESTERRKHRNSQVDFDNVFEDETDNEYSEDIDESIEDSEDDYFENGNDLDDDSDDFEEDDEYEDEDDYVEEEE